MLHRLREACGNMEAVPIEGAAEIDETYIGGKERNKSRRNKKLHAGRGPVGKTSGSGGQRSGSGGRLDCVFPRHTAPSGRVSLRKASSSTDAGRG